MLTHSKRVVGVIGLVASALALIFAIRHAPLEWTEIKPNWICLATLCALISLCLQATQTRLFAARERLNLSWMWSLWLSSEKAWANTIFPAKAGTVGSVALLNRFFRVRWPRYVRFMLQCSILSVTVSASGVVIVWAQEGFRLVAIALTLGLGASLAWRVYEQTLPAITTMMAVSTLNFVAMTVGVGASIAGLGYEISAEDIFPVGIALNTLSIVSITPGNFGARELLLASLSPILSIPLAVLIQGSTAFVFLRLLVSLVVATLLRSTQLTKAGSRLVDKKETS